MVVAFARGSSRGSSGWSSFISASPSLSGRPRSFRRRLSFCTLLVRSHSPVAHHASFRTHPAAIVSTGLIQSIYSRPKTGLHHLGFLRVGHDVPAKVETIYVDECRDGGCRRSLERLKQVGCMWKAENDGTRFCSLEHQTRSLPWPSLALVGLPGLQATVPRYA
jgi:hypothetical protein